jgi:hypothetical protein
MDRPTGRVIRRYERARPGELIHVDIKKLGKIPDGGGWKVLGRTEEKKNNNGMGSKNGPTSGSTRQRQNEGKPSSTSCTSTIITAATPLSGGNLRSAESTTWLAITTRWLVSFA